MCEPLKSNGWPLIADDAPATRRRSVVRIIAQALALLALLSCTACSRLSCNKGKIEGQWQLVSSSSATPSDNAMIQAGGRSLIVEFADDGKMTVIIDAMGLSETLSGSYSLMAEDLVVFSDFPGQKLRSGGLLGFIRSKELVRVTIEGDDMRMMGLTETLRFTRRK